MEDRHAGTRADGAAGGVVNGGWRISVDGRCLGSGLCAATAPDHFRLAGSRSEPVTGTVEPAEAVLAAAESCPVEAITVREAATGLVLAPET